MSDGFYRAFEDKHRGSRESIKDSQRVYLKFITPLKLLYGDVSALDLGCGRGEWLELLVESGFNAYGVDLDDGMLAECRSRGQQVKTQDAIAALKDYADECLTVVSGFHLAEHIPFDVLQVLITEALRVLKPGGLLILETPNPENIVVGATNFYLDPTHRQPIPPLLLSFLAEYLGFSRVKVLRLQGPIDLNKNFKLTVHDVLGGVSPDYAVVAQKNAALEILQLVSDPFNSEYGVSLDMVAGQYDLQHRQVEQRLAARIEEVMAVAKGAELAIKKFTAPWRWLSWQRQLLRENGVLSRLKHLLKKLIRLASFKAVNYFDARPDLRAKHSGVNGNKGLYDFCRSVYLRMAIDPIAASRSLSIDSPYAPELTLTETTQHAAEVYKSLKAAMKQSAEG